MPRWRSRRGPSATLDRLAAGPGCGTAPAPVTVTPATSPIVASESRLDESTATVVVPASEVVDTGAAPPPESFTVLLGIFVGGLAFFFLGVDGIKSNLRQLTSRRFRSVMGRLTAKAPLAAIWGLVFGAITQSATAVAFIMVGMISSGLLAMRRALLVVSWANLGTVMLVFIATIDIRAAVLYLIGISGLLIVFEILKKVQLSARVFLSIGMLLFGLKLMSDATRPFPQFEWFGEITTLVQTSTFMIFLLGAMLRVVIQSSSAIVVIGIALAGGGLFSDEQVLLLMHGTAVGVGATVLLLSSKSAGTPRQIALYQGIINAAIGIALLGVFYLGSWLGVSTLQGLLSGFGDLSGGFALAFLVQQGLIAALGTALLPFSERLLERLAPVTAEERLEQLEYLGAASTDDVDTALVLLAKEQSRLVSMMPEYLETIRSDAGPDGEASIAPATRLEAAKRIDAEIRGLAGDLAAMGLDSLAASQLLKIQQLEELAMSLQENLVQFARTAESIDVRNNPTATRLRHNLVEGLDTIMHASAEAARSGDELDIELLLGMTADRGELMERIRSIHLTSEGEMPLETRANLLYLTTLFERIVWTVGQLARSRRTANMSGPATAI